MYIFLQCSRGCHKNSDPKVNTHMIIRLS